MLPLGRPWVPAVRFFSARVAQGVFNAGRGRQRAGCHARDQLGVCQGGHAARRAGQGAAAMARDRVVWLARTRHRLQAGLCI
jgi:hypothetical protein